MRTPHSAQRTDSENSTRSSGSLGTSNRRSSRFEDAREDRGIQEVRRLLDQDEALSYSQMLEYDARALVLICNPELLPCVHNKRNMQLGR